MAVKRAELDLLGSPPEWVKPFLTRPQEFKENPYLQAVKAQRLGELKRKGNLLKRNVIVNGDDMLFKCPDDFYPIFVATANEAGFKISQGKQYLSPDCAMINSQVFRRVKGTMERCGYLNLKLIKGTSLKTGESNATPVQIGKDLSLMVSLCPWANCAVPAALSRWKSDWFGPVYRPNWYLPVHLGGFGLDIQHAPKSWRVTKSQREMAARFINDPRMALYRRPGMNIPTTKLAGAIARWRMVVGDYVPTEAEVGTSDAWLERLAFAARAHQGASDVSDKVFVSHFRPQYRLKPMSIEGLNLYWTAQVFAVQPPPCPPLNWIRVSSDRFT
jgi:hypothetical protein